jgi:hypothetical protein
MLYSSTLPSLKALKAHLTRNFSSNPRIPNQRVIQSLLTQVEGEQAVAAWSLAGYVSVADTIVASLERNDFNTNAVKKRFSWRILGSLVRDPDRILSKIAGSAKLIEDMERSTPCYE